MEPKPKNRDKKILDILSKTAEAVDHIGIRAKLASAIVFKNEIVSIGFNRKKTHPFQRQFQTNDMQIYLHAETDAINRALKYISKDEIAKATLYVARVKYKDNRNKKAIWAESKPCTGCQKAIKSFGISNVVYTSEYGISYLI